VAEEPQPQEMTK